MCRQWFALLSLFFGLWGPSGNYPRSSSILDLYQPRMYADDTHIEYASAGLHSVQSSLNLASQQTSYGVPLSGIHFSPALGRNECVTN